MLIFAYISIFRANITLFINSGSFSLYPGYQILINNYFRANGSYHSNPIK